LWESKYKKFKWKPLLPLMKNYSFYAQDFLNVLQNKEILCRINYNTTYNILFLTSAVFDFFKSQDNPGNLGKNIATRL